MTKSNYYSLVREATQDIKKFLSVGVEVDDIIYPILEKFGLSERKTREIAQIILKGGAKIETEKDVNPPESGGSGDPKKKEG